MKPAVNIIAAHKFSIFKHDLNMERDFRKPSTGGHARISHPLRLIEVFRTKMLLNLQLL